MKTVLLLTVLSLGSVLAHADDGGLVGIKVNDISVNRDLGYDNQGHHKLEPIANPSFQININGKEASKLLQILPPELYVFASPQYPKFKKLFDGNFRALSIDSKPTQPALVISCQGGVLDEEGLPEHPRFHRFHDGAHCTISISASPSEDGDLEYNFDPSKNSCH